MYGLAPELSYLVELVSCTKQLLSLVRMFHMLFQSLRQ